MAASWYVRYEYQPRGRCTSLGALSRVSRLSLVADKTKRGAKCDRRRRVGSGKMSAVSDHRRRTDRAGQ